MSVQSHFFIESGSFTQKNEQSFGPVSKTKFRLTSKFTLTGPKKAFAICKGVILLQPQTGAEKDKVNLILRPYTQPFPGLNIKYFVYRGLQRSDFFTSDSAPKIIKKTGSTSDFINKINEDFEAFHKERKDDKGNAIDIPDFTAQYIGYDTAVTDNTIPLSNYFFKESQFIEGKENGDYELPMISIGKSLGNFAKEECGIDVVLNYGDYKHSFDNEEFAFDLGYARKNEAFIDINGTTDFQQKLQREQSTQFIDIAAFYGLYVPEGIVSTIAAGTKTDKKGVDIYNTVINNFATKNNWYIYIQGDRTRSYDFYGDYKIIKETGINNLKTGLLEDSKTKIVAMTEAQYGTEGWPLIINTQKQATAVTTNNLYLQLVTDNNNNTAFYGHIAKVANAQKDNFINADGLRLPPDTDDNYERLTSTIQLTTPAIAGENIATLSLLLYQGIINEYDDEPILDTNGETIMLKGQANFFDDVFGLINAKPLLKLNGSNEFSKITDEKLHLINAFYDKKQQGISIVQTLTINDTIETGLEAPPVVNRVTYLTETVDVMNNAVSATGSMTPATRTSHSASGVATSNKTYELPEPYYYARKLFTDSTQTITGLELKTLDGSTPGKIILGITQTENESIKALTEGLTNPRLFLIDLFEDDNELVSPENIKYQKYKVAIVAEDTQGNKTLSKPDPDVFVYSLDRNYHFSKGYSEYMPSSTYSKNLKLIYTDITT
jgi:hypothetical protein